YNFNLAPFSIFLGFFFSLSSSLFTSISVRYAVTYAATLSDCLSFFTHTNPCFHNFSKVLWSIYNLLFLSSRNNACICHAPRFCGSRIEIYSTCPYLLLIFLINALYSLYTLFVSLTFSLYVNVIHNSLSEPSKLCSIYRPKRCIVFFNESALSERFCERCLNTFTFPSASK